MREAYPLSEIREGIARAIRLELANQNIPAAELARRAQIDDSYLSRRMTGAAAFTAEDLAIIAAALGVPAAQLLGDKVPVGTPPPSPPPPPQPGPQPSGPGRPKGHAA
jgi:transcriptional regulator with XRE-family HTH domain